MKSTSFVVDFSQVNDLWYRVKYSKQWDFLWISLQFSLCEITLLLANRESVSFKRELKISQKEKEIESKWWNFTTNCCELSWISLPVWCWGRNRLLSVEAKFFKIVVSNRGTSPVLSLPCDVFFIYTYKCIECSVSAFCLKKYPLWVKLKKPLQSFLCRCGWRCQLFVLLDEASFCIFSHRFCCFFFPIDTLIFLIFIDLIKSNKSL